MRRIQSIHGPRATGIGTLIYLFGLPHQSFELEQFYLLSVSDLGMAILCGARGPLFETFLPTH